MSRKPPLECDVSEFDPKNANHPEIPPIPFASDSQPRRFDVIRIRLERSIFRFVSRALMCQDRCHYPPMSTTPQKSSERLSRLTLVAIAILVSALFLWMIRDFLMALLLAAVLSGWCYPLYRRMTERLGGHAGWGASLTVLSVFLVLIIPLLGFITIVGFQAMELARDARPWIEEAVKNRAALEEFKNTPLGTLVAPYETQILEKLGSVAGNAGSMVVAGVTAVAQRTVDLALALFVMLYAMFFFLLSGKSLLERILFYLPLASAAEDQMVGRFVSVTRATIKGTVMIGVLQGALAGLGFWVAGIKGVAVWATAMAILSAIPPLGPMLIWGPTVIFLAASGRWGTAAGLLAWCVLVVSAVDNVLRPRLVGRDTKLPDLLILISTLGGLIIFGPAGVIVGPIVAALFVTIWELYGTAFAAYLPPREALAPGAESPDKLVPKEETPSVE